MGKTYRKVSSKAKDRYGLRLVHADVTLRSASGKSIRDKGAVINAKTISKYYPPEGFAKLTQEILLGLGLRIIAKNRITICIAAPLEEFERIFDVRLTKKRFFPYVVPQRQRVPDQKGCGIELFFKGGKKLPVPERLRGVVESIHLATPMKFCAPSSDPPTPGYFHLKVPDDISRLVDANPCHHHGFDGTGVVLAMPDQGTFDHPYYTARGYNIMLDETAYDDTADTGSHGTAIAANALAVAPGVKFIGVRNGKKISSGTAAFQQAASYNPDVISISWGTDRTDADVADLRAAIAQAIAQGITVCCACGNGGPVVFPSSMSDVISVGGVYADAVDALQASTYASSGVFANDPGRQMPDLSGFVGQNPNGIYITLPCHPDSDEDQAFGGGTFPNGDETATDDGWLVASGTSSATPQVAASACLLIQSDPATFRGQPALIKQRLVETALDVTTGTSGSGEATAVGADNATGAGVVDAYLAVNRVDVWLRDNDNDRGLIPAKEPHWISPDIKVLASPMADPDADFDAAANIGKPEYETKYYVYIKARNRGVDPANNVTVGFYYADPCTFISYPADWKNGQSGDPAQGSIEVDGLRTNLYLIDSIPAQDARVAGPFEWMPPLPTAATQTQTLADGRILGHFCLLARLDCAADPIVFTGGAQSTVRNDNNIGMKNLWVVEAEMTWPLMIGKLSREMGRFSRLEVELIDPLRSVLLEMRIPQRVLQMDSIRKSGIKLRESKKQKGVLFLQFSSSHKWKFDVLAEEKIPLLCRIVTTKKGVSIKGESFSAAKKRLVAKVNIQQFADVRSLGGASAYFNY
jgi:serine protease AprX